MTFSIRNAVRAAGMLGIAIAAGCQSRSPVVANTLDKSPIVVDGAMQARDWDVSHVMYQNGTVRSPADRFLYQATPTANADTRGLVETPLFLVNIVALPFTFFTQRPGELVNQYTASTPDSYSGIPALDADEPSVVGGDGNGLGVASGAQGVPSHSGGSGQSIGGVSGAAPAGH